MQRGEDPMKLFSRTDEIVSILKTLEETVSETNVNRKLVRALTSDYEMEQRTILYK